jgi:hypothetical protein
MVAHFSLNTLLTVPGHGVRRHCNNRKVSEPFLGADDRRMCRENPGWGAPRIHGERLKLGIDIGASSVNKYMVHCRKPVPQVKPEP